LTSLEDLLDSFAGTLVVISHDRYFLERTCDKFVGLLGNGALRELPRGIEEYLELRNEMANNKIPIQKFEKSSNFAKTQFLKKNIAKYEKQIHKLNQESQELNYQLEIVSLDHKALTELNVRIVKIRELTALIEEKWLFASLEIENTLTNGAILDINGIHGK